MKKITIAIDGHSSTGKSTLAKDLAKALEYSYVDTGAMYRAVALYCLSNGVITDDEINTSDVVAVLDNIELDFKFNPEKNSSEIFLNGTNLEDQIRTMRISNIVSKVSSISEVRKKMVSQQQEMGKNKAVVMDGRDIGTVVFPDAELKIYMTAQPDIRAQRRLDELQSKGNTDVTFEEVLENLEKRDKEDQERLDSPLLKAEDAKEVDNSYISREEQFNLILGMAKQIIEN